MRWFPSSTPRRERCRGRSRSPPGGNATSIASLTGSRSRYLRDCAPWLVIVAGTDKGWATGGCCTARTPWSHGRTHCQSPQPRTCPHHPALISGAANGTAPSRQGGIIRSMGAMPDPVPDPVDDELESLLAQPAIQARLTEFERRLQADELDLIPHSEVRHQLGLPAARETHSSSDCGWSGRGPPSRTWRRWRLGHPRKRWP